MDRAGRTVLTLLAVGYLAFATQLQPPYYLADVVEAAPFLWEAVFGAAGLSCLACGWWPPHWPGWANLPWIAGAFVMLAAGSRGIALIPIAAGDPEVSYGPTIGWTMIFALQAFSWPHIAPHRLRRDG